MKHFDVKWKEDGQTAQKHWQNGTENKNLLNKTISTGLGHTTAEF